MRGNELHPATLHRLLVFAGTFAAALTVVRLFVLWQAHAHISFSYVTGLPIFNYDPNTGFGFGARGYLFYDGKREDPLFAYEPYRQRVFLQAFAGRLGVGCGGRPERAARADRAARTQRRGHVRHHGEPAGPDIAR